MSKTEFSIKVSHDIEVYKIKVIYRYRTSDDGIRWTSCLLFTYSSIRPLPDDLDLQTARAAGFAECRPPDHFSRDIGRKLVLARAMKSANLGLDTRTQVWEQYHDGKYTKRK